MGLSETQRLLARLYLETPLRERFFADPQKVAAEFGLSPEDAAQWTSLSRRQTEFFARSLKFKRLAEVRRLLPRSAELLGSSFTELFLRYAEAPLSGGLAKHYEDALAFVRFAERVETPLEPRWALDLLRYEAAWLHARATLKVGCLVRMFRHNLGVILNPTHGAEPERRLTVGVWCKLPWSGRLVHGLIARPFRP